MLNKKEIIECFRISRIILYTITFLVYLYGRFFYDRDTMCNHGYTCLTCGLRTAMYHIEHGRFIDAFNSNKLCVLVLIFFLIAAIDIVYMCICYAKTNKR